MEPQRLAARQKRYRDLLRFTQNEVSDPRLKNSLAHTLAEYKTALARYWSASMSDQSTAAGLDSLERELEKLHSDARLRTSSR